MCRSAPVSPAPPPLRWPRRSPSPRSSASLSRPRARPPLPARRERVCRRQLRHHGPVHLRQRRRESRPAARLPRPQLPLAPIPANVALVIANTMVKHSIAGGEYTTRRAEVGGRLRRHRQPPPRRAIPARRHRRRPRKVGPRNGAQLAQARPPRHHRKPAHRRRRRCPHPRRPRRGRPPHGRGAQSYSRDFEASCEEADAMVELAQELPGLIGARLTGGGFGGCTINLVERSHAAAFAEELGARYAGQNRHRPPDSHLPRLRRRAPSQQMSAGRNLSAFSNHRRRASFFMRNKQGPQNVCCMKTNAPSAQPRPIQRTGQRPSHHVQGSLGRVLDKIALIASMTTG